MNTVRSLIFLLAFASLTLACFAQTDELWEANVWDSTGVVIPDAHLTFTTIDVPGAVRTHINGINTAGDLVGDYGPGNPFRSRGFLYHDGVFTFFHYPLEGNTVVRGINDSGLISGSASPGFFGFFGFVYDGTNFTVIRRGDDEETTVNGINNAGDLVGGSGTLGTTLGFEMRGDRSKTLKVDGDSALVSGTGVNNYGDVVGCADTHGFTCRSGKCNIFDVPGAFQTQPWGVNDLGIVVGYYEKGPHFHGFVSLNGKYFSVDFPGAQDTYATSINDLGQIVGEYFFSDPSESHGFVTSAITPADFH